MMTKAEILEALRANALVQRLAVKLLDDDMRDSQHLSSGWPICGCVKCLVAHGERPAFVEHDWPERERPTCEFCLRPVATKSDEQWHDATHGDCIGGCGRHLCWDGCDE